MDSGYILDCLELGDHTAKEIQQYISDDEGKPILRTVQSRLKALVADGQIVTEGKGRATKYRIANGGIADATKTTGYAAG